MRTTPRARGAARTGRTRGEPTRAPGAAATPRDQARAIYEVVRAIPRGRVATYGQLAALAGIPSGHRIAARAMQVCPSDLPWQRVVGKKDARRAQISIQEPEHAQHQRALLEAEGVVFDAAGTIALRTFGWLPVDVPTGTRPRARRT